MTLHPLIDLSSLNALTVQDSAKTSENGVDTFSKSPSKWTWIQAVKKPFVDRS
jgi:hypothetical protein